MNQLHKNLKMTETIQQLKEDIALLQMKLQKLEEMENHITPCEEAYKRVYGFYPETYEDSWSAFQDGFFEGCKVEEPDESVEDYLKPEIGLILWAGSALVGFVSYIFKD